MEECSYLFLTPVAPLSHWKKGDYMNKVLLMGRLTRDPEVRYSTNRNGEQTAIGSFSIAVDRRFAKESETQADFFNCTAFGKQGEFVEKYLKKGTKVVVVGRLQNDNYTNKNGEKVYSVRIITEEIEFAESKAAQAGSQGGNAPAPVPSAPVPAPDDFLSIPDGLENDLPFK